MTTSDTSTIPATARAHSRPRPRGRWLRWLPVLALAALVAVSCGSSSKTKSTDSSQSSSGTSSGAPSSSGAAPQVPKLGKVVLEFGKVTVQGTPLPKLTSPGSGDPAVRKPTPVVSGQRFDGTPITLSTNNQPTVIFFLAHWCPHCNREVPALVQYWKQHGPPAGVQLLSVTTGSNPNYPNWPPSSWIKNEKWPVPVLADDENQDAASAFGLPGYPFFVMLKPDGTVFLRNDGEWPVSDFNAAVADLVKASK